MRILNAKHDTLGRLSQILHNSEKPTTEYAYQCDQCVKRFTSKSGLQKHLYIHNAKFECGQCQRLCFSGSELLNHLNIHSAKFQCALCDKVFPNNIALDNHCRIHRGDKQFHCTVCDKAFFSKSGLKLHLNIHTEKFQCALCGTSCSSPSALQIHLRTHSGERPFKCGVCDKTFAHASNKKLHLRTHTKEKRFKCQYCHKGFISSSDFSKHKKIHTGERPFSCDYCGKRFIKSSNLNVHLKTHRKRTEENLFNSKQCHKGLDKKSYLARHHRSKACNLKSNIIFHSEEKPYQCEKCGDLFHKEPDLIRHFVNTHSSAKQKQQLEPDSQSLSPEVLRSDEVYTILPEGEVNVIIPTQVYFVSQSFCPSAVKTAFCVTLPTQPYLVFQSLSSEVHHFDEVFRVILPTQAYRASQSLSPEVRHLDKVYATCILPTHLAPQRINQSQQWNQQYVHGRDKSETLNRTSSICLQAHHIRPIDPAYTTSQGQGHQDAHLNSLNSLETLNRTLPISMLAPHIRPNLNSVNNFETLNRALPISMQAPHIRPMDPVYTASQEQGHHIEAPCIRQLNDPGRILTTEERTELCRYQYTLLQYYFLQKANLEKEYHCIPTNRLLLLNTILSQVETAMVKTDNILHLDVIRKCV